MIKAFKAWLERRRELKDLEAFCAFVDSIKGASPGTYMVDLSEQIGDCPTFEEETND